MQRWARVMRQTVYALVLIALIMGGAYVEWFGLPLVGTYVTFFLTEEIDFGLAASQLQGWLNRDGVGWWPPWEGWFEPIDSV